MASGDFAALTQSCDLSVTGPLGQAIRMQWLGLKAHLTKSLRAPAWDEFLSYDLFNDLGNGTIEAIYPRGEFVLETLRREAPYYENVMGLTMYNEGQEEMLYSLRGIWRNLYTAKRRQRHFGKSLVVILVDGYAELHKNAALLGTLESRYKLYSKTAVEEALNVYASWKKAWEIQYTKDLEACKKENLEHLRGNPEDTHRTFPIPIGNRDLAFAFETRLTMGASDLYAVNEGTTEKPALDVLFVVKAENKKKLHSHLWLFYGFCMKFRPKYVFLIDMGTEPMKKSLLALHAHLEQNPDTGGCCGEIIVKDAPWYDPLVGAQWFEYKIGHIIYKTFESLMGFIPVLPGAFSAYRWETLTVDNYSVLKAYLLPFIEPTKLDWTLTNIYFLAEDRIMSEEIMRVGEERCFTLRFVKAAKALTEGVDQLVKLIKQRRRWINGSWFALIKVLKNCQLLRDVCFNSKHSLGRKILFAFQSLYMSVIMLMTWFSVGIFYTGYALIAELLSCKDDSDKSSKITETCGIFMYVYIFIMGCNVLVALATDPENVKPFWVALCWFFSAAGIFMVWGLLQLAIPNEFPISDIVAYEAAGLFFVMGMAILCYWENFFTMLIFGVHYILLTPTYINILTVFAICKTDDVSWGTRGKDEKGSSQQDEFNWKKTVFLAIFVACNVVMGGLVQ